MTISDFLGARIGEDEAMAQGVRDYAISRYGDEAEVMLARSDLDADDAWCTIGVARILAECATRRAIVRLHLRLEPLSSFHDGDPEITNRCSAGCGMRGPWRDDVFQRLSRQPRWPCDTLRALASVYADHPDYRAEWAS